MRRQSFIILRVSIVVVLLCHICAAKEGVIDNALAREIATEDGRDPYSVDPQQQQQQQQQDDVDVGTDIGEIAAEQQQRDEEEQEAADMELQQRILEEEEEETARQLQQQAYDEDATVAKQQPPPPKQQQQQKPTVTAAQTQQHQPPAWPKGQLEVPYPPDAPMQSLNDLCPQAQKSGPSMMKRANAKDVQSADFQDTLFITITSLCSGAIVFSLVAAGVWWYRVHKRYKSAEEAEYPQYGVTGPTKERSSGDEKLASSAHLYHYQHTKQQIIAMEQPEHDAKGGAESDDSDKEEEDGDYSVYECPGLAQTGDIEVSNPLFANADLLSPRSPAPQSKTTKEE